MITFEEYKARVFNKLIPSWRRGQQAFNFLYDIRPELANSVRGNYDLDPFYRDELVAPFLAYVEENWDVYP